MNINEIFSKEFKKNLLETFKFTKDFLEKYNLKYWACGGTCIGAVRHQGFIPWDDDIDIMMPRDDYFKLLDLRESMKGTGYVMTCNRDDGYYYDFGKIMNENTTIVEYSFLPYVLGVYVDIYPVYQTDLDEKEINKLIHYYKKHFKGRFGQVNNKSTIRDVFYQFDINTFRAYFGRNGHLMAKILGLNQKKLYKEWADFEEQLNLNRGDKIVSYIEGYDGRKIYQKEWFDDLLDMPFEDTTIKVPKEYDKYLAHVFGDYMQLPPENKRISLHTKYYTNLKERIDINEVHRRIAKGEKIVF